MKTGFGEQEVITSYGSQLVIFKENVNALEAYVNSPRGSISDVCRSNDSREQCNIAGNNVNWT